MVEYGESQPEGSGRVTTDKSWPKDSTFKIMISTDNHLGYYENDDIRGNDSFDAFEEVLQIAQKEEVDFILLAGDLFHENKPSRNTLHRTLVLLRKYCLGDNPCTFNFVSDPKVNFHDPFQTANHMDPNINVAMPIYSIHGNHDDPSGVPTLAALDLLSVTGLANYFGKIPNIDQITLEPILLTKGSSKLALYGLGNVRDEFLMQSWDKGNIIIKRPHPDPEKWFNLLALHQNRVPRSKVDYLPEKFLNKSFDLAIWGHEHECIIDPTLSSESSIYVSQPGSSVATSLCPGEAVRKHVAVCYIHKNEFQFQKHKLKTVRPMVFNDISVTKLKEENPDEDLQIIIEKELKSMLNQANLMWADVHNDLETPPPIKPLLRLRMQVDCKVSRLSVKQFVGKFAELVANPNDVIRMTKAKANSKPAGSAMVQKFYNLPKANPKRLETLLLEDLGNYLPRLVPSSEINDKIQITVHKDEKNLLTTSFTKTRSKILKELQKTFPAEESSQARDAICKLVDVDDELTLNAEDESNPKKEDESDKESTRPIRKVAKTKSTAASKKSTSNRAAKRKNNSTSDSDRFPSDEEMNVEKPAPRRGRPKRQATKVLGPDEAAQPKGRKVQPRRQAKIAEKNYASDSEEVTQPKSGNSQVRNLRNIHESSEDDASDLENELVQKRGHHSRTKQPAPIVLGSSDAEEPNAFEALNSQKDHRLPAATGPNFPFAGDTKTFKGAEKPKSGQKETLSKGRANQNTNLTSKSSAQEAINRMFNQGIVDPTAKTNPKSELPVEVDLDASFTTFQTNPHLTSGQIPQRIKQKHAVSVSSRASNFNDELSSLFPPSDEEKSVRSTRRSRISDDAKFNDLDTTFNSHAPSELGSLLPPSDEEFIITTKQQPRISEDKRMKDNLDLQPSSSNSKSRSSQSISKSKSKKSQDKLPTTYSADNPFASRVQQLSQSNSKPTKTKKHGEERERESSGFDS